MVLISKTKGRGRRRGSRNKGYFYREGRGWFTKDGSQFVPLVDDAGNRLRERTIPDESVKAAYHRWSVGRDKAAVKPPSVEVVTVSQVCAAYLAKAKASNAAATFEMRNDMLWDFCRGLPARFRPRKGNPERPSKPSDRIHAGYGDLPIGQLRPIHVDEWLQAHPDWDGGQRSCIQAVKAALNYGVKCGLIEKNPIKGYKAPKEAARVTYLTPEQELALCQTANMQLSLAIKVLIRTGARPGCEFAALTSKHIRDHGDRMEWVFQPKESKTGKLRTIRISDPEIIGIVRKQLQLFPTGPVFRNTQDGAWSRSNLSEKFRFAKNKLVAKGMEFDDDCCLYSCRHTYAKRVLQGFWIGKVTNIETLAELMGNSAQVCRDHYLQWCDSYSEPLWDAC